MNFEHNMYNIQSKTGMFSRKHHDSLIYIELIISPSYVMTRASKNETKARATQGERENRLRNRTKQDVYKYTTNL